MKTTEDFVYRMATPAGSFRIETTNDGVRQFVGLAMPWNAPTVIDSWEGHFVEQFRRGAFKKTTQEHGDRIRFLFNHGFDPTIGDKPLGSFTTYEDRNDGLWVTGPLSKASFVDDIAIGVAEGHYGMSVRFQTVRDTWNDEGDLPVRTVEEARLREISIVTFPAYEATKAGIRSQAGYELWQLNQSTNTTNETEAPRFVAATEGTTTHNDAPPQKAPVVDPYRIDRAETLARFGDILRKERSL